MVGRGKNLIKHSYTKHTEKMLPNKENPPETAHANFRLPVPLLQEIADIMYTERYRSRTDVVIELLNIGLATRRGLELTKGEVKA